MRRKLPSTGALLAFEAAGRYENFARAAEELCLSEGAVSKQISRFEAELGIFLFNRVKGRIYLTDAGRDYLQRVKVYLDNLEQDTSDLCARPNEGALLNVTAIATFANKWLIPRLPKFKMQCPNVIVNITERPESFDFESCNVHAAIQHNHPDWQGIITKNLFSEELIPVCSPDLVKTNQIQSPSDIENFTLLHKNDGLNSWKRWCDQHELTHINPKAGLYYDMFSMVIEAALAGLGVGLVPKIYVQQEIAQNRLIVPLDSSLFGERRNYCVDYPARMHGAWPLQAFVSWLGSEAASYVKQR